MKFLSSSCLLIVLALIGSAHTVSFEKDVSLSLKEKQALDKFKEQVMPLLKEDYMKTDIYLIRWLRAKNFDVNQAMLKENLRWREEKNMKGIQKENFEDMWQTYPATVNTHDKEGRPMIDIYFWDIRDCVLSGRGPRLLRYLDMLMDNVTLQVFEQQQKGYNVTQWKVLSNTLGFNMIQHGCGICIPLWMQFISSLENHFQGWMDEFIIVEAPRAAHTIVDILRPLLSRQTSEALKIFGSDKSKWMPYMDSKISREERTPHYGGTKPPVDKH